MYVTIPGASSHPFPAPHPTNGGSILPPHFPDQQAPPAGYLPPQPFPGGQVPAGYMPPVAAGYGMPTVVPHGQFPSAPPVPFVTGMPVVLVNQQGGSDDTRLRDSQLLLQQQLQAAQRPKKEGLEEPLLKQQ